MYQDKIQSSTFYNHPLTSLLNGIILAIGVVGNIYLQAFCNPTVWAAILLTVCFINTIFFPRLIKNEKLLPFISFINGISFCLFIYCIIFLGRMNYLGIIGLIFLIGILVYIPHFFALQIFWYGFIKLPSKVSRISFGIGVTLSICLMIYSGMMMNKALKDIEKLKSSNFQTIEQTFMMEKILGMGIIYHTRFCEYDGWRPPKHEPILVMGLWLNQNQPLLKLTLEERVLLYKKFFPEKKIKFDCSCARSYRKYYHNDELWDLLELDNIE